MLAALNASSATSRVIDVVSANSYASTKAEANSACANAVLASSSSTVAADNSANLTNKIPELICSKSKLSLAELNSAIAAVCLV